MKTLLITILILASSNLFAQTDTISVVHKLVKPEINWKHDYSQTLTMKVLMSKALYDGKLKRRDNGRSEVFLTMEEVYELIKKIDNLTIGIPKIIYLVGWQYNGHDSKYPAWFEGNYRLKRPQDENTLESLRWLMKEAKKYNTTVSLHINMFDAYDDSPLWDEYVKHDIIAKNKDGSLREGEWGWPISYAQEWKLGYAQKRIDSLCSLLPVQDAGTIHIDAFHTWPPIGKDGPGKRPFIKGPISPYLDFTVEDETKAQENIIGYWASKGIDVTSEGVKFLRESSFAGLQPMAWWYTPGLKGYIEWPANLYTGGIDNSEWGKLFGSSIHGEETFKNDKDSLSGFLREFCLNTVPWYYLNRLERKYVVRSKKENSVIFSSNVETSLKDGRFTITKDSKVCVDDENILLPALWMKSPALLAYSGKGYDDRTWNLTGDFKDVPGFTVYEITLSGKKFLKKIKTKNGKVILSLKPDKAVLLVPAKK